MMLINSDLLALFFVISDNSAIFASKNKQMDKDYIIGQFKYYCHHNNIEIEDELDQSDAVNEFICREGFYGQEVYNLLMKVEL